MSSMPTPKSRRPSLLRIIGSGLTIALLIYLLSQQGWEAIWLAVQNISWPVLVLTFAIMIVSRLAVSARWHVLLRSADMEISLADSTKITFAGLFATNFLPTTIGGDVVRLAGAIQQKLDGTIAAASLIADRLVGLTGMALAIPFGILSIITYIQQLGIYPGMNTPWTLSFAAVPTKKWWRKMWEKGKHIMYRLYEALKFWVTQPTALIKALAITGVHMVCFFSIISLLFHGLHEDIPFYQVAGLFSFVYIITLLPISINGYGLQEISISYVFSELAGVSFANAVAVALLFRTLTMIASLPGALFLPGILPDAKAKKID